MEEAEATCISCGMEIVRAARARASNRPNLCRACERSMSEEEIFAVMDA